MTDLHDSVDEPSPRVKRRRVWETSLALASDKFISAGKINTVIQRSE